MHSVRTLPRRALVAAAFAAVTAACSLVPGVPSEPPPAALRLRVVGGARLNPDEGGQSLPTAVRVYQLKGVAKVRGAELGALLRDSKEVLGEDLVSVDELFVDPGAVGERTFAIEKGVRAVAIVAVFRRPAGETWRDVIELPGSARSLQLEYALDEYRLGRR